VCQALGLIRPVDKTTVTEVTRLLQHQDGNVRLAAVSALREMGAAAIDALPPLLAVYKRDPIARWAVVTCLGRIKPVTPEAVKAIQASLRDQDATVRVFAIIALCRLDSPLDTQLAELCRLSNLGG